MTNNKQPVRHIFVPDTQVKPGVPTDHLEWIGQYIVDKRPDVVVHIGDHADMPSLSVYDRGKIQFEGRRYSKDIEAANAGFDLLNKPLIEYNETRKRFKEKQWWPRRIITLGNHEDRITRAIADNPILEGTIGLDDLNYKDHGWEVVPFKSQILIDDLAYSHFFYNPMTGSPYGGMPETMLKNVGYSFVMGHQQVKKSAEIRLGNGDTRRALICGAAYLHDEEYKGPQANNHFRGIFVLNEVKGGNYDLTEVSLGYLCRHYEGHSLEEHMQKYYPGWADWGDGLKAAA